MGEQEGGREHGAGKLPFRSVWEPNLCDQAQRNAVGYEQFISLNVPELAFCSWVVDVGIYERIEHPVRYGLFDGAEPDTSLVRDVRRKENASFIKNVGANLQENGIVTPAFLTSLNLYRVSRLKAQMNVFVQAEFSCPAGGSLDPRLVQGANRLALFD